MIAVIGAMDIEIDGFAAILENGTEERIGGLVCRAGTLYGESVVTVCCGVGMVAAAAATAAIICRYAPSLVINIGVAGGLAEQKPLDMVLPARAVQHDMDTTAMGDEPGYLSDLECVYLETDASVRASFRALGRHFREGTLASGDQFVAGDAARSRIVDRFGADCCDMEGGAILHAATMFETPCVILRAISDAADGEDFVTFARAAADRTIGILAEWFRARANLRA